MNSRGEPIKYAKTVIKLPHAKNTQYFYVKIGAGGILFKIVNFLFQLMKKFLVEVWGRTGLPGDDWSFFGQNIGFGISKIGQKMEILSTVFDQI